MTTSSKAALLALMLALGSCTGEPSSGPSSSPPQTPPTDGTCTPPSGPAPFWETLASPGISRLEVAAAIVGRELFVAGGYVETAERVTAAVEIYDLDGGSWRRGPDLPIALHHAMGVSYDGAFVVLGGFAGDSFFAASDRAFALRDGRWEELPRLARGRAAGGAAIAGDHVVVMGGQDGERLVGPTEVFDGTRWRDAAQIPTLRDHLAAAGRDGFAYAVGGRRMTMDSILRTLERYDPETDRWEKLADMPTARGGNGAATLGRHIVVLGGEGPEDAAGSDGVFAEVEAYDVQRDSWVRMIDMRTPRHGIGVAADGSFVYVAAGGPRVGFSASRAFEGLHPGVELLNPC